MILIRLNSGALVPGGYGMLAGLMRGVTFTDDVTGFGATERLNASQQAIIAKVYRYADKYGLDRDISYWQIYHESRFIPTAKAPNSTAKGLGQFLDTTWKQYGKGRNPFDPDANLDAWGRLMATVLKNRKGRYDLALADYADGPVATNKYLAGKAPLPKQSQEYISFVLGHAGKGSASKQPALALPGAQTAQPASSLAGSWADSLKGLSGPAIVAAFAIAAIVHSKGRD